MNTTLAENEELSSPSYSSSQSYYNKHIIENFMSLTGGPGTGSIIVFGPAEKNWLELISAGIRIQVQTDLLLI